MLAAYSSHGINCEPPARKLQQYSCSHVYSSQPARNCGMLTGKPSSTARCTSHQCADHSALTGWRGGRKSTRLNSSHQIISYAVFCLKKKKQMKKFSQLALAMQASMLLDYLPERTK